VIAPSLTLRLQTRYADLDPNGHVNHVRYLVYMETARVRFMHEHGGGLRGHVLVARSECDHRAEVPASTHEVEVTVRVESVGRTSLVVRHDITDAGRPVAVGRVVLVAVDQARRPRPVTDAERGHLMGVQPDTAAPDTAARGHRSALTPADGRQGAGGAALVAARGRGSPGHAACRC